MRRSGLGLGLDSVTITSPPVFATSTSAPSNLDLGKVRRQAHLNSVTWLCSTNQASGMKVKQGGQRKMGLWVRFGKFEVGEKDGGLKWSKNGGNMVRMLVGLGGIW